MHLKITNLRIRLLTPVQSAYYIEAGYISILTVFVGIPRPSWGVIINHVRQGVWRHDGVLAEKAASARSSRVPDNISRALHLPIFSSISSSSIPHKA